MTRPDRDERSSVNPTPRNALPPTSVAAKLSVRTTLARATEAFPGWWLGVIAAGAVAVLILAFWLLSPPQRSDLWFEVGKGCIQLVVVVLLGAVAKIVNVRIIWHGLFTLNGTVFERVCRLNQVADPSLQVSGLEVAGGAAQRCHLV